MTVYRMCARKGCEETFKANGKRRYCSRECTKLAMRGKPKKCVQCGKEFQPNSGSQLVCSHACKLKRIRDRAREKRGTEVHVVECPICGKVVETRRPQQVTCGDKDCQAAQARRRGKANREKNPPENRIRQDIKWGLDADPFPTLHVYPFGSNDCGCRAGDSNFNPVY
jgi:hypothetical protein